MANSVVPPYREQFLGDGIFNRDGEVRPCIDVSQLHFFLLTMPPRPTEMEDGTCFERHNRKH